MKKIILATSFLFVSITNAQGVPVFDPDMLITSIGIVTSPTGEEVDKIIDGDISTKFLDFELADGMGFDVDLGATLATANYIEITTANDFPERDPIDFEVSGSADGTNFTFIDTEAVICLVDRFRTRLYEITNTNAYRYYRVQFTAPCDPSGGTGFPSIQLAEVQLYEAELGISSHSFSEDDISIYPNPNSGRFTLKYSGDTDINLVSFTNVSGQLIKTIDSENITGKVDIKLPEVAKGLYFLTISSKNKTVVKKIKVN